MVSASDVGKHIPLTILRSGKEMTIKVKIGKMPKEGEEMKAMDEDTDKVSFRGLTVDDITPFYKRRFRIKADEGVVIIDIEKDSAADKSELQVGDVISKIEKKKVRSKEDFKTVTSKIKGACLIKTNRGYAVLKEK